MGAFDTYEAVGRCPQCHDLHWVRGQTQFFLPDLSGLCNRHFTPGAPQPLEFSPAGLAAERIWDGTWFRVRELREPMQLSLLADLGEFCACDCGLRLAVVLDFDLGLGSPPTATLIDLTLLDALAPRLPSAVDFADGENMFWTGDADAYTQEVIDLAHATPSDRGHRLHEALVRHCTSMPALTLPPWTTARGPTRCEDCGDVRERSELILLSHPDFSESFFGPGWGGGTLRPGSHVTSDLSWLASDVDRGYVIRLRHPVTRDELRVLGRRLARSCRCGAGKAAFVLHFARDGTGLTLDSLSLRVVRGRADLADVDFAEGPEFSRQQPAHALVHGRAVTRDEAVRLLLSVVFDVTG